MTINSSVIRDDSTSLQLLNYVGTTSNQVIYSSCNTNSDHMSKWRQGKTIGANSTWPAVYILIICKSTINHLYNIVLYILKTQ